MTATQTKPIDLYYWPTPNGHKITIFLEETGTPYTIKPVNIGRGGSDLTAIAMAAGPYPNVQFPSLDPKCVAAGA